MYERFTDRSRTVMQLANEEARQLNRDSIGTEHILLGLVREGAGVAAYALKRFDVELSTIRLEVARLVRSNSETPVGKKPPLTPRAKKVIEHSMEEARNLKHQYVGTEHLLLAVLREPAGVAVQVLTNLGLNLDDIRTEVLNILGHGLDAAESGE